MDGECRGEGTIFSASDSFTSGRKLPLDGDSGGKTNGERKERARCDETMRASGDHAFSQRLSKVAFIFGASNVIRLTWDEDKRNFWKANLEPQHGWI